MGLSSKKQGNMNLCIYVCFFLKAISDMFYQIQIMDIALTGVLMLLLIYTVTQKRIRINICDICIGLLAVLFTVSFGKDLSFYRDYVKILSAFMLYFLGRFGLAETDRVSEVLGKTYLLAFGVNLIWCMLGFGTIVWGNALTYKGLYYFKTDFAAMVSCFVAFHFLRDEKYSWLDYVLLLVAGYFVIITNARIFYLIYSVLIGFILLYRKDQKLVSVKGCAVLFVFAVIGVLSAAIIPKLLIFEQLNMISFDLNGDILGSSNLQGRNKIWGALFADFSEEHIITQLFGTELSFAYTHGMRYYNEHSLYVKLILNTGYIGMVIWLIFVMAMVFYVWKAADRKAAYLCSMLLAVFLIEGISVPTIVFTGLSWLPLFFCGYLCGIDEKSVEKI